MYPNMTCAMNIVSIILLSVYVASKNIKCGGLSSRLTCCHKSPDYIIMLSNAMKISLVLLILLCKSEEGKAAAFDVEVRGNNDLHGIVKENL